MPVPFLGMPINFGRAIPSGSHCGTYRSFVSGGGHTNISIKNYNYGNGGCCGDYNIFGAPYMGGGYYGGGCCGGGGISAGAAWTALGIGAGIGLLASPLGRPIMKGIGTGFKYAGRTLWEGGKAIVNTFCYAGKGILNGIRKLFGKEPIENKWETFEMKNPFRSD